MNYNRSLYLLYLLLAAVIVGIVFLCIKTEQVQLRLLNITAHTINITYQFKIQTTLAVTVIMAANEWRYKIVADCGAQRFPDIRNSMRGQKISNRTKTAIFYNACCALIFNCLKIFSNFIEKKCVLNLVHSSKRTIFGT